MLFPSPKYNRVANFSDVQARISVRFPMLYISRNSTSKLKFPKSISFKLDATRFPWCIASGLSQPILAPHSTSSPTQKLPQNSALRAQQLSRHFHTFPHAAIDMASLPISERGYHPNVPSGYGVRKIGAPNTLEHRIFIEKDGTPVSPFHDIPLYANDQRTVLNMIVEIPRWTNAKMEVCYIASESVWARMADYVGSRYRKRSL